MTVNRVGAMFTFFFHPGPVTDWESAKASDTARFGRFFRAMLDRGIYLRPVAIRSRLPFGGAYRRGHRQNEVGGTRGFRNGLRWISPSEPERKSTLHGPQEPPC